MPGVLQDKSIIITGAATGIGQAAARLFAQAGAKLTLADSNIDGGKAIAAEIEALGSEVLFQKCDVSSEAEVSATIAATLDRFGRLDGAFNNAGIGYSNKRVHEVEIADWERTISVNLTGVFLCMKHEIGAMLRTGGGAIVNTGSVASVVPLPNAPEYNAAKHGLLGLTRNVALDYGRDGIRVNAILPGSTQTPLLERQQAGDSPDDSRNKSVLDRIADPKEVAEGAVWLLSDAASFVTGADLKIDGGFTLA